MSKQVAVVRFKFRIESMNIGAEIEGLKISFEQN